MTQDLIQRKAQGEHLAMLTAYDYPTARLLDESGVDMLLVGDSLGMVVLGYPDTTEVTLADIVHHTRAVARGAKRAVVVADLPFHTYETPEQAVASARSLIEAGAGAVKLEGGVAKCAQIEAIRNAGIEVVGHIGMLPQRVRIEGGYRIKGKTAEEGDALVADARAVESAGACAMVVELVAHDTATRVTQSVKIPTIGIGAGSGCDGQVLVTHDLIGLFPWFVPKFATQRAQVHSDIQRAAREFVASVKA